MSVLVLSDTHLTDAGRLPDSVFALAERADHIIHAGDHSTLDVVHVLSRFASLTAVRGNIEDTEVLARLPEQAIVKVGHMTIGVRHDAGHMQGRHTRLVSLMPGCDVRIYGHTHMPEVTQYADGSWILNPGSPTQRRRAPEHTVAWITQNAGTISINLVVVEG